MIDDRVFALALGELSNEEHLSAFCEKNDCNFSLRGLVELGSSFTLPVSKVYCWIGQFRQGDREEVAGTYCGFVESTGLINLDGAWRDVFTHKQF